MKTSLRVTFQGGHGPVASDNPTIALGGTATFTLAPSDAGYVVDVIGGTCPESALDDRFYTLKDTTSACSLTVSFALDPSSANVANRFEQR